jgi:predicted MFS family arabinose efflux permease
MIELISKSFDPPIILALVLGSVCLIMFAIAERFAANPVIPMWLFRIPTMSPSLAAAFCQSLANFAVLFLLIMYLQGVRHLSPLEGSLWLIPGYLVGGAASLFGGRLADRWGAGIPATAGLLIQIAALAVYCQLSVTSPLWVVSLGSVVNGIGLGAFFPSNNTAVMRASPQNEFGVSSGLLRTCANVGMVFSFAAAILAASHSVPRHLAFAIFVGTTNVAGFPSSAFVSGMHTALYLAAGITLVAAALSALRIRSQHRQRATPSGNMATAEGSKVAGA